MGRILAVAIAALAFAGPAAAGGPKLVMGAAEDAVRQPNVVMAKTQLDLLSLAGLKAVRITSTWSPGLRAPLPGEQNAIDVVADAAALTGTRVIVSGVPQRLPPRRRSPTVRATSSPPTRPRSRATTRRSATS